MAIGNIKQLFARDAWDFQEELFETYGPVTRIHGFFRVSSSLAVLYYNSTQRLSQAPWLYVYDSKALHSVCMKDHESYHKGTVTDTSVARVVPFDHSL